MRRVPAAAGPTAMAAPEELERGSAGLEDLDGPARLVYHVMFWPVVVHRVRKWRNWQTR